MKYLFFLHLFVYFLRDQKNNNPFPGGTTFPTQI